jgi:predicted NBD/HSP70 family sugar kinase
MTTAIGVVITDHIAAARLEELQLAGKVLRYPGDPDQVGALEAIPDSELVDLLAQQIKSLADGKAGPDKADRIDADRIDAIGVAVPGFVRSGVIEESPNLPQMKGTRLADQLTAALKERGISAPVHIANDADAIAAGVAATRDRLDKLTRVWTALDTGAGRTPRAYGRAGISR